MARPLVDALRIVSPCDRDVAAMDDAPEGRAKYCTSCEREVHDIAALGRAEVEALFREHRASPPCIVVRVRRSDGAIRVADGYIAPRPATTKRRLPVVLAASLSLVACSATARPPTPPLVPVVSLPLAPTSESERGATTESVAGSTAPLEPVEPHPQGPRPLLPPAAAPIDPVAPPPNPETKPLAHGTAGKPTPPKVPGPRRVVAPPKAPPEDVRAGKSVGTDSL